jgi:hypothetical protein
MRAMSGPFSAAARVLYARHTVSRIDASSRYVKTAITLGPCSVKR